MFPARIKRHFIPEHTVKEVDVFVLTNCLASQSAREENGSPMVRESLFFPDKCQRMATI